MVLDDPSGPRLPFWSWMTLLVLGDLFEGTHKLNLRYDPGRTIFWVDDPSLDDLNDELEIG